jgi:hypothetical protein
LQNRGVASHFLAFFLQPLCVVLTIFFRGSTGSENIYILRFAIEIPSFLYLMIPLKARAFSESSDPSLSTVTVVGRSLNTTVVALFWHISGELSTFEDGK